MNQTYLHRPGLNIKAKFSTEKPPLYRYWLEATKVGAPENPKTVCAIMQNPSYAGVEFADRSAQVLERVVFEKNYSGLQYVGRLIIVNQFAFIQTNNFVGTDDQIGRRNSHYLKQAIKASEIIIIAWGKDNRFYSRQDEILQIVNKNKLILQTSRHPSRVIYDGFIQPYGDC